MYSKNLLWTESHFGDPPSANDGPESLFSLLLLTLTTPRITQSPFLSINFGLEFQSYEDRNLNNIVVFFQLAVWSLVCC